MRFFDIEGKYSKTVIVARFFVALECESARRYLLTGRTGALPV